MRSRGAVFTMRGREVFGVAACNWEGGEGGWVEDDILGERDGTRIGAWVAFRCGASQRFVAS